MVVKTRGVEGTALGRVLIHTHTVVYCNVLCRSKLGSHRIDDVGSKVVILVL